MIWDQKLCFVQNGKLLLSFISFDNYLEKMPRVKANVGMWQTCSFKFTFYVWIGTKWNYVFLIHAYWYYKRGVHIVTCDFYSAAFKTNTLNNTKGVLIFVDLVAFLLIKTLLKCVQNYHDRFKTREDRGDCRRNHGSNKNEVLNKRHYRSSSSIQHLPRHYLCSFEANWGNDAICKYGPRRKNI